MYLSDKGKILMWISNDVVLSMSVVSSSKLFCRNQKVAGNARTYVAISYALASRCLPVAGLPPPSAPATHSAFLQQAVLYGQC